MREISAAQRKNNLLEGNFRWEKKISSLFLALKSAMKYQWHYAASDWTKNDRLSSSERRKSGLGKKKIDPAILDAHVFKQYYGSPRYRKTSLFFFLNVK